MNGAIITNGQLALLCAILFVYMSRTIALQALQLRNIADRRIKENMNRYHNAIDLPPAIDSPPPGYTVFDLIQLSQNERVAYSPMPDNYQPKVPLLPPPKRSPTQHSRYTSRSSNREPLQSLPETKKACKEESRFEQLSSGTNMRSQEVELYDGQWFWITRCHNTNVVTDNNGQVTQGVHRCYGVEHNNGIIDATCRETMAWVLAYSRLKSDPFADWAWDYIAVPNCCACKIVEAAGELVLT